MSNLETLFRWKGELRIKDSSGEPVIVDNKPLVLYQRVVGDADINEVRKQALKASAKLRKELRDASSDAHLALIPDYEELDDDTLRNMVVLADAVNLRTTALETTNRPPEPLEPDSDASLEEQEKYEAALREHATALEKAVKDKTQELMDERRAELEKLDRESLVDIFIKTVIDSLCRAEMMQTFNSWCAYLGTYKDKKMKKRAFDSYAAFDNAAAELKQQIISGYLSLEMSGEDLKN